MSAATYPANIGRTGYILHSRSCLDSLIMSTNARITFASSKKCTLNSIFDSISLSSFNRSLELVKKWNSTVAQPHVFETRESGFKPWQFQLINSPLLTDLVTVLVGHLLIDSLSKGKNR